MKRAGFSAGTAQQKRLGRPQLSPALGLFLFEVRRDTLETPVSAAPRRVVGGPAQDLSLIHI